jgi:hypothetical protein
MNGNGNNFLADDGTYKDITNYATKEYINEIISKLISDNKLI